MQISITPFRKGRFALPVPYNNTRQETFEQSKMQLPVFYLIANE